MQWIVMALLLMLAVPTTLAQQASNLTDIRGVVLEQEPGVRLSGATVWDDDLCEAYVQGLHEDILPLRNADSVSCYVLFANSHFAVIDPLRRSLRELGYREMSQRWNGSFFSSHWRLVNDAQQQSLGFVSGFLDEEATWINPSSLLLISMANSNPPRLESGLAPFILSDDLLDTISIIDPLD